MIGLDKRQLLARHTNGDTSAFPELVEHFNAEVFSYLVRAGVRQADRDDLFQEIFFSVHKAAKRYDSKLPLEPWLFTIVVNSVRSYFRKITVRREDTIAAASEGVDTQPRPDQIHDAKETAHWVEREIKTLPLEQREVLLLASVKGFLQEDIALALKIPLNTVKTHLRRGRMKLLEKLKSRLVISEEAL